MTNLTVSTDHFDPSVYWPPAEPIAMPYDRLDALRYAGILRLEFLDRDGGFVLIREFIPRPTALISCTHSGSREAIQDGVHRWRGFLRPSQFAM